MTKQLTPTTTPYYPQWRNTQTAPTPVHVLWAETPKEQETIKP